MDALSAFRGTGGHRAAWIGLLAVLLVALAIGVFARFHDLGGAPLADDEYYTSRSIDWILAEGVPAIPSGGYYVRGPLYQYAAAASAWLFGADAFAYRLPAALCGVAVAGLGFLYARRHGGLAVGLAVATALLLSSWAIEFSRLVRFYSLFQLTLLLFLLALDRAYFEARSGWRFVPHAALLLAAFAHEVALLLVPLLFLPLWPGATGLRLSGARRWGVHALVSLLVALVIFQITLGLDLRTEGVSERYPEGYEPTSRFGGPFATPALPFFRLSASPVLHLAAILLIAAAVLAPFAAAWWHDRRRIELPDLVLGLALVLGIFHQFAAMGLVLVFAIARHDLWRLAGQPPRRWGLFGAMLAVGLAWLLIAAADPSRLVDDDVIARWGITEPGAPGSLLRALWSTFFGWPDFYRTTLRPFASELPELGLVLLAALAWFVAAHRHAAWPDLLRHPGALVLYWAMAMALFNVGTTTSRYWLPLLPVLYTLIALSLAEIAAAWRGPGVATRRRASLVFLLLFALGPDFQPRHLLDVGDEAVRYRTGPFARFDLTWYPRRDVRGAAETVTRRLADRPGARVVVDTLPAMSYYLDRAHAVYLDRTESRFQIVSRERGRRDMWSDRRLLSTPEELLGYAAPATELWLVRPTDPARRGLDLAALPQDRLSEVARSLIGRDGRIELVRLRPDPASADRRSRGGSS